MESASPLLQLPRELRDMILAYAVSLDTDHADTDDVTIGCWGKDSMQRLGSYLQSLSLSYLADLSLS